MTRRGFFGCAAAAAALLTAGPAEAGPFARAAPRATCAHTGCRHHRPGDVCGLSLHLPPATEIR